MGRCPPRADTAGLTDSAASLDAVLAAAAEHGAAFVSSGPLRLAPLVKEHYLGAIATRFPDLLPRYERAYVGTNAPQAYREQLEARLATLRRRYRFAADEVSEQERHRHIQNVVQPPDAIQPRQLALPFSDSDSWVR